MNFTGTANEFAEANGFDYAVANNTLAALAILGIAKKDGTRATGKRPSQLWTVPLTSTLTLKPFTGTVKVVEPKKTKTEIVKEVLEAKGMDCKELTASAVTEAELTGTVTNEIILSDSLIAAIDFPTTANVNPPGWNSLNDNAESVTISTIKVNLDSQPACNLCGGFGRDKSNKDCGLCDGTGRQKLAQAA